MNPRYLVVSEDPQIAFTITDALASTGESSVETAPVAPALQAMERGEAPELVFVDCKHSEDLDRLLHAFDQGAKWSGVPVVALTSDGQTLGPNVVAVIHKPFAPTDVLGALRTRAILPKRWT